MERAVPFFSLPSSNGLVLEAFHETIRMKDVAHFEALLCQYPAVVEGNSYAINVHHFDLWDQIDNRRLCDDDQWSRCLEEMVLLLLKHGYDANRLAKESFGMAYNRAWKVVSLDSSSIYLLRCYGDLGRTIIDPDWHPPRGFQGAVEYGPTIDWKPFHVKRNEKMALLTMVWEDWTPREHQDFPRSFRLAVFTFLLVRQRYGTIRRCVSKCMIHLIFGCLARVWCLDRLPIEHEWSDPPYLPFIPLSPPLGQEERRREHLSSGNLLLLLFAESSSE
jgi:hypothetical protein